MRQIKVKQENQGTLESYHGQVFETQEEEEEDHVKDNPEWMNHQLKFKKHIDDQYRAQTYEPTAEDYVTEDTKGSRRNTNKG